MNQFFLSYETICIKNMCIKVAMQGYPETYTYTFRHLWLNKGNKNFSFFRLIILVNNCDPYGFTQLSVCRDETDKTILMSRIVLVTTKLINTTLSTVLNVFHFRKLPQCFCYKKFVNILNFMSIILSTCCVY